MNFKYHMPTKVMMGRDCIINNSEAFKSLGNKALIVTGTRSAKINGSEADVKAALEEQSIEYIVYDKVMSNPTVDCVYEGVSLAKEVGADFVIAIGGGSPIDAGKVMAMLMAEDIKEEALFKGGYNKAVPIVAVPTTAGTGSEATQYAILTNDRAKTKSGVVSEAIFPTFSFLDAKYMEALPVEVTVNTAIDALSHAVEGMLSVKSSFMSDALAKESIGMIMECLPKLAVANKTNDKTRISIDTRDELLYASFLAGMVIAQTGTITIHAMGYSLTYFKHIDHGRANGLLMGEYLKFVESKQPELAKAVYDSMDINGYDECRAIMDQLLGEKEDITPEEINQFSSIAIKAGNIALSKVKPQEYDLINIYSESFEEKTY